MNRFKKVMLSTSLVLVSSVLTVGCGIFNKKNNQITDQELQFDVKESLIGKGYRHLSYVKQEDDKYKIILQVEEDYAPKDAKVTNKDKTYTFTYSEQDDAYISIVDAKKGDKLTIDGSLVLKDLTILNFDFNDASLQLLPASTKISFTNKDEVAKNNPSLEFKKDNSYSVEEFKTLLNGKQLVYKLKNDFGINISYNFDECGPTSYFLLNLINAKDLFSIDNIVLENNIVTQTIKTKVDYQGIDMPNYNIIVESNINKYSIDMEQMDNFAKLINANVTEENDGFYLNLSAEIEFNEAQRKELSHILDATTITIFDEKKTLSAQIVDALVSGATVSMHLENPSSFIYNGKNVLGYVLKDDFNSVITNQYNSDSSLLKLIDDSLTTLNSNDGIGLSIVHDSDFVFEYLNDTFVFKDETYRVDIVIGEPQKHREILLEITESGKSYAYIINLDGEVIPLKDKLIGADIHYDHIRINENSNVTKIKVEDYHLVPIGPDIKDPIRPTPIG